MHSIPPYMHIGNWIWVMAVQWCRLCDNAYPSNAPLRPAGRHIAIQYVTGLFTNRKRIIQTCQLEFICGQSCFCRRQKRIPFLAPSPFHRNSEARNDPTIAIAIACNRNLLLGIPNNSNHVCTTTTASNFYSNVERSFFLSPVSTIPDMLLRYGTGGNLLYWVPTYNN